MIRFGRNEKKGTVTAPAAEPEKRSSSSESSSESLGLRVSELSPHDLAVRQVQMMTSSMIGGPDLPPPQRSNKCNLL
jgi:hypothetical protein